MAKTAAKQPIGQPEPDAHISMYEQAKWPLTKRDQTYLSQANKFWSFINTDTYLVGFASVSGSDIFALTAVQTSVHSLVNQTLPMHCCLVSS